MVSVKVKISHSFTCCDNYFLGQFSQPFEIANQSLIIMYRNNNWIMNVSLGETRPFHVQPLKWLNSCLFGSKYCNQIIMSGEKIQ